MKDTKKSAEELSAEENTSAKTPEIYPPPYKVINGGLCVERTTNQGKYDQKLCNFVPQLAAEITVDDGLTESKRLRIVGEHAGGYSLPEIEIAGSEFTTFNWMLEHWGVDCNLEPGSGVREHIRYAIQSTAPRAERKSIYAVTGWKKIGGEWRYMMPRDESVSVQLPGKLKRYEMKSGYTPADISTAFCLLEMPIAPKEIICPLLAFTFLSPLNEFLHRANCEPKFVLFLLGKTGTRKSTLAALFLSFFGSFTASDLPLSFRDTANSIIHHAFALKDVLTCIDDFHPCGKPEENQLTATAQAIMRAYGDRAGRGRLKADASPMDSRPPQGNAIITAEFAPDIGESGTARYFSLELKDGDVDLGALSLFQKEAASGVLNRCMFTYTEWIGKRFLSDEKAEKDFIDTLAKAFAHYRDEFVKCGIRCHGRVPEIVAWLRIGMYFFLSFMQSQGMLDENRLHAINSKFIEILYALARKQSESIEQDKPTYKFIRKLYALLESGQAVVLNRFADTEITPPNFIGYEDDHFFYLNSDMAHRTVKRLCEEQGEAFSISQRGLLKALAEEGLIEKSEGQNTKSVRFGNKTKRVLCLYKSKAQMIVDSAM